MKRRLVKLLTFLSCRLFQFFSSITSTITIPLSLFPRVSKIPNHPNFPKSISPLYTALTLILPIEMYSNFKEQAIEYVKQAVIEDNAGNYPKAFPLYMNALEYFRTHLKYEKNPKIREAITAKFTEYLRRAEEIRAVLDEGGGTGSSPNGPDAAVQARPKGSKPKDGGGDGGGGDDAEKEKLRAGLNSAIVREKPNVKWNDVAGLESAKQALQEAVILPVKFPQFFTGINSVQILI